MTGTLWQSSQSFYFLFSMQVYIIQSAICKIPYNLILVKKFFIWILFWSLKRKGWYVMITCFPKSTSKWFFGGSQTHWGSDHCRENVRYLNVLKVHISRPICLLTWLQRFSYFYYNFVCHCVVWRIVLFIFQTCIGV